ncbi:hypothetical protein ACQW5G_08710 (plasmid) [Fructilactobacillus sp. Tb1]|uniref:hypothetical protein n=1 Tax=Fructilactobacillus sp. Tb1 TaxID=3422304 RepID=UPI003D2BA837
MNGKYIGYKPYVFQLPREYRAKAKVDMVVYPYRKRKYSAAVITKMYHTEKPSQTHKSVANLSEFNFADYLQKQLENNIIDQPEMIEALKKYQKVKDK